MQRFIIEQTDMHGLVTIKPNCYNDERGYFSETWNYNNLKKLGFDNMLWQDSESMSKKNVLRGLHYQWNKPMGKLIRVVRGSILDVCVDIRKNSPTYGSYTSILLSEVNKKQLWAPPGFAHGILSLEEDTVTLYKCSSVYNKNGEAGIDPFDKELNIDWGIKKQDVVLSVKDSSAKSFLEYKKDPKF